MNLNIAPYYDDFSESDQYQQVLFKPSVGVQTRELNNVQSILQNQIARFGQNVFQEGSMVIPGNVTYNGSYNYVKLQNSYNGSSASSNIVQLVGYEVEGQTSGVTALVVNYFNPSNGTPTLYVQYTSTGTNTTQKTFLDNEVIAPTNPLLAAYSVQALASGSTGTGSAFSVAQGIYFVRGYFSLVLPQTILLDPYDSTPTCSVGFLVNESIVTAQSNSVLLDNAQGYPNYSAPGADRYKLTLTLSSYASGATVPTNFVQITSFVNGVQQGPVNQTTYSIIADTLASRTFDEAGNYTVNPFSIKLKSNRNNSRGAWVAATVYLAGDVVTSNGNYYTALIQGTSSTNAPTVLNGIQTDGSVVWMYTIAPYFNQGINLPSNTDTLSTAQTADSYAVAAIGPGKAYVNGYELQKVATTNVELLKPRTTAQNDAAVVNTEFDNYILITNVHGLPDFTTLPVCTLYDQLNTTPGAVNGNPLGTCRLMNVSYVSGTPGTTTAIYRASLGDIQLSSTATNFNRQVKQIAYKLGSTYFTASVSNVLIPIQGSVTASASTTLTGTGTLFLTQVQVGDWLWMDANNYAMVTAIASNTSLTLSTAVSVTGEVPNLITTNLVNSQNNHLLWALGNPNVASARNEFGQITTSYTVIQSFSATANSSGVIVISVTNSATDTFAPTTNAANYIVYDTTSNSIVNPASLSLNAGSTQLTVTTTSALSNHVFMIEAAVNRVGNGTEKTKTLTGGTLTLTTAAATSGTVIPLGEADGYSLMRVMQDTGSFAAPTGTYGIDITANYNFDSGQRFSHYAPASIIRNTGAPAPTAPIQISFLYFSHSATGDYFTVNSYLGTVDYKYIPSFSGIFLGDVIDFRSRVDTSGSAPSVKNGFPAVGYDTSISYRNYLPRNDIIALDSTGTFSDIMGVPATNPQYPVAPTSSMSVYKIQLSPYVPFVNSESISYTEVDNQVYTMADIAQLDQRITNLEYYTSLNLLEQNTLNLPLTDSNGLPLYKNGIATDNFDGKSTLGDVTNPDFMCSMDTTNDVLRPFYTMQSLPLVEQATSTAQRSADGYQLTGNILSLPYTQTVYASQPYGTNFLNVNPFAVYSFIGNLSLTPPSDNWFSTTYLPDQVTQVVDNYTNMNLALQASGVLGTQWNAWQTTWSGVTSTNSTADGYYIVGGNGNANSLTFTQAGNTPYAGGIASHYQINTSNVAGAPAVVSLNGAAASQIYNQYYANGQNGGWLHGTFQVNTINSTTATNQTRTGIQTTLVPQTTDSINSTSTVSQTAIPYMRQRNLQFHCSGLKPTSEYYAYFDSTNLSSYVSPASMIVFTAISGQSSTFDHTTNVGSASNTSARSIAGDSVTVLSVGDVLTGQTSGATAIVVGQEFNIALGRNELYVVNVVGTFAVNETINGSVSGASAILNSYTPNSTILTTSNGNAYGLLEIPNNSSVSFRCGTVNVVLSDNPTSALTSNATSFAVAQFVADGTLNTMQNNLTATTNGQIVQSQVTQNQTIYGNTSYTQANFLGYYDPLSQSFSVTQASGIFATGVDLFFESADASVPVTVQLVTMSNGYPSTTIVPYSTVTLPANQINISTNGSVATRFTFPAPVYLNGNAEYAIRIMSNSNAYNLFVGTLGSEDLVTGNFVSQTPYAGVLFESKNSSTWQPNMTSTLKFNLYAAQFSTAAATFNLQSVNAPAVPLPVNPFSVTNGSNQVTVSFISHGLSNGSTVTLSGATSGNGLPALNGNYVVENCTLDTFTITAGSNATQSGLMGGSTVVGTGNVQYDVLMTDIQDLNFSGTTTSYAVKTTSGKSINGTETPYLVDGNFTPITNNANTYFANTKLVANAQNSTINMGGNPSLVVQATLQSNSAWVSPVIDISRCSATLIQNKINSPATNNETVAYGSSSYAKYVTKPLSFANPASNIHIMFGYNLYPQSNILVYYKTALSSSGTNITQETYTLANPDSPLSVNSGNNFMDASYTIMNLPVFDTAVIKIVLQSTNEAQVPQVETLRLVFTS